MHRNVRARNFHAGRSLLVSQGGGFEGLPRRVARLRLHSRECVVWANPSYLQRFPGEPATMCGPVEITHGVAAKTLRPPTSCGSRGPTTCGGCKSPSHCHMLWQARGPSSCGAVRVRGGVVEGPPTARGAVERPLSSCVCACVCVCSSVFVSVLLKPIG